jgi:hypothetical protein
MLGGLVGLVALRDAVLAVVEHTMLYYPSRVVTRTPAALGLAYQDVWFTTDDGVRLHGWWVPGRQAQPWLWLHGNAGNLTHRLDNLAAVHHRLGVSVFIFDYRGYGLSAGAPSEEGLYRDAEAALAQLTALAGCPSTAVVVFGRSLGTAVAVELAVRTRVRALILENAFASIPAMARHLYPFLPTAALVRSRYDSLSKIPRVGVPVLILHSRHDPLIPYAQGQALYAAAAEPKAFHTIEAATHYDTYLSGGAAYWEALQRFLDTLPPAPVGDGCASAAGPAGAGAERAPVQPPSGRL